MRGGGGPLLVGDPLGCCLDRLRGAGRVRFDPCDPQPVTEGTVGGVCVGDGSPDGERRRRPGREGQPGRGQDTDRAGLDDREQAGQDRAGEDRRRDTNDDGPRPRLRSSLERQRVVALVVAPVDELDTGGVVVGARPHQPVTTLVTPAPKRRMRTATVPSRPRPTQNMPDPIAAPSVPSLA